MRKPKPWVGGHDLGEPIRLADAVRGVEVAIQIKGRWMVWRVMGEVRTDGRRLIGVDNELRLRVSGSSLVYPLIRHKTVPRVHDWNDDPPPIDADGMQTWFYTGDKAAFATRRDAQKYNLSRIGEVGVISRVRLFEKSAPMRGDDGVHRLSETNWYGWLNE